MSLEKRDDILEKIYFMLKRDERGAYVTPVDSNGEMLENIEVDEEAEDTTSQILAYIKGIKEDSFFIDWENEYEEAYLNEHPDLIEYLIDNSKLVNEKMKPLKWVKRENTLALIIKEKENSATSLNTELLLNGSINDFIIINEDLILADNTFYIIDMESNDFHTLKELVGTIDESGLENFLTLTIKYFKNIEIEYKDYKVVRGEKCTPNPQLVIEKISYDNSLYLQVTLMVSGMHYDFLKGHEIEKVAIVNNMDKKISICEVDISRISEAVEDIVKILAKNQKNLKVRASYYLDESNLIIMQEKLAKEFIMQDLLQLASKYRVVGTDKLRKYNIKAVKPKVIGKFSHSIDFLEGEIELEIEGEKFSILDVLSSYKKDSYIMLSDGTSALINKKYIENDK